MKFEKLQLLRHFDFNLERIVDEFDLYFKDRSETMPNHIKSLYYYYSHLAENAVVLLVRSNFKFPKKQELYENPSIVLDLIPDEVIEERLNDQSVSKYHYLGILQFPLGFYVSFLEYIQFDIEKPLQLYFKNIPLVEQNIENIQRYLYDVY